MTYLDKDVVLNLQQCCLMMQKASVRQYLKESLCDRLRRASLNLTSSLGLRPSLSPGADVAGQPNKNTKGRLRILAYTDSTVNSTS